MTPEDRAREQKSAAELRRQRALQAQELLANPLFKEAWDSGHKHFQDRIEEERDPRKRDDLWRALRVFRVVRDHFEALVKAEEDAQAIHAAHERRTLKSSHDSFSLRRDGRRWVA